MTLVAVNVLMEPDQATVATARAFNARLKAGFPLGFALDDGHAPHITLVQCFVRTSSLDAAAAAVRKMLHDAKPLNPQSRAVGLYALKHANLGLMGIVVEATQDLQRLQQRIVEVVAPFSVSPGTADAFLPEASGTPVGQETVDYVSTFITDRTGKAYHPHLTVGIGTSDIVDAMKAEPFEAFTVRPVAFSIYHLGDYGTARKKLHELHHG